MSKWLKDFLSQQWWQGLSAILGIVFACLGIYIAYLLFQIQQHQAQLERESTTSIISIHFVNSRLSPGGNGWALLILRNEGPSAAEFAKLKFFLGSAGVAPEAGPKGVLEIAPEERAKVSPYVEYSFVVAQGQKIVDSIHPSCEYTVDIERWQSGETLRVAIAFVVEPAVAKDLALQDEEIIKARFVPEASVFTSSLIHAGTKWDGRPLLGKGANVEKFTELIDRRCPKPPQGK